MTQVIPREDNFEVGPGARGSTLSLWVRMRPWTSDVAYGSGGVEFSDLKFWTGDTRMQDGFSRDLPVDVFERLTVGVGGSGSSHDLLAGRSAGFCETTVTTVWPKMGGAFFRNAIAENLDVQALFGHVSNVPLATNDYVRFCGLAARLQGGTTADAGDQDQECVEDQEGYFFVRAQRASGGPAGSKFYLLRSDGAGSYTRLADAPSGNGTVNSPTTLQAGVPARMRLKVITNGSGDVEITGWHGRVGDTDDPVITYTDTSGSKITGDGRTGFFASFEWYAATGQNGACICSWIQARDITAAALLYRDEFVRNVGLNRQDVTNIGKVAVVTAEDYEGDSLLQAFYHDLGGHTDSTGGSGTAWGQLVYSSDDVLIDEGNFNTDLGGQLWAPSQFKALSDQTARVVDFQFLTVGTAGGYNREFRVLARESGTLDLIGFGYELVFEIDDLTPSTTGTAILRRYILGVGRDIGTVAVTLSETTTYEAELRTRNITAGVVTNAVEIKAFLDSTQLVFVEDSNIPVGVSIDSSGTVVDSSSRRLSDERGEGIGARIDSGANGILVEDWALGVNDVPEELDADRVQIAVSNEGASPVGTLVIPAGWSVTKTPPSGPGLVEHRSEAGHVRAHGSESKSRDKWRLSGVVTKNALGTLTAFWDNHKGSEVPFNWTDPQGNAHVAHFIGRYTTAKLAPEVWRFDARLEILNE